MSESGSPVVSGDRTCGQSERVSAMMSLALDGRLSASGEQHMAAHLMACPVCHAEWTAMVEISALLSRAPTIGPPLGFAVRVERRLEEKSKNQRRLFGGVALATGSLSLAGITLAAVLAIIVGVLVWPSLGAGPALQDGSTAVSQVANGFGLMGRGASLVLRDLLARYVLPLLLLAGAAVAVLAGAWVYLCAACRRTSNQHHNGFV